MEAYKRKLNNMKKIKGVREHAVKLGRGKLNKKDKEESNRRRQFLVNKGLGADYLGGAKEIMLAPASLFSSSSKSSSKSKATGKPKYCFTAKKKINPKTGKRQKICVS